MKLLSCVQLFETPWTIACQAPLSMGFPRQEHWSGLPFPSPGDFSDPGIEPRSPALQADSLPFEPPGNPCSWFILRPPCVMVFHSLRQGTFECSGPSFESASKEGSYNLQLSHL